MAHRPVCCGLRREILCALAQCERRWIGDRTPAVGCVYAPEPIVHRPDSHIRLAGTIRPARAVNAAGGSALTQVELMASNSQDSGSGHPPALTTPEPTTNTHARILREHLEEVERSRHERSEQSSELNSPAVRIRAWERLYRLTLPRDPQHAVLAVVAAATHLTLEQIRTEQRRRAAPAAAGPALEPQRDAVSTVAPPQSEVGQDPGADR
jgi:hypothetical protein